MKYAISFFISCNLWASPIQIHYEGKAMFAQEIRKTLISEYSIPEVLISMKSTVKCSEVTRHQKLDLCLKNNGDLLLVSIDREFVYESLKVFKAP